MAFWNRVALVVVWMAAAVACSSSEPAAPDGSGQTPGPGADASPGDNTVPDTAPGDASPPNDAAPGDSTPDDQPPPPSRKRVEIDLAPYLTGSAGGEARVFVSTSGDQLVGGQAAQGRVGDYVLENDAARFVVEKDDRAIGPCPYGGNVIDAWHKSSPRGGESIGDVIGEICLLINAGQTLDPETYEILEPGGPGKPAVLAVTGKLELLDFINIKGMVSGFLRGANIKLGVDTDAIVPVTVTNYFIMHPGENAVQIVTAFRNDGDVRARFMVSHLINSGGEVRFFNPLSTLKGYGYKDLGADALTTEKLLYLAFAGKESGYLYLSDPVESLKEEYPLGGGYVSVSGVAVSLLGNKDIFGTLLADPGSFSRLPGVKALDPGKTAAVRHWMYAGTRALSSMIDPALAKAGVALAKVNGQVNGADGKPAAGVVVTALDKQNRPINQTVTDSAGAYSFGLPAGAYTVLARIPGATQTAPANVTVTAGTPATVSAMTLGSPATLKVEVKNTGGAPIPARITIVCVGGTCPMAPTAAETDITVERLAAGLAALEFTGMDGTRSVQLPPGDYEIIVSRGMEYSSFPPDAHAKGGRKVTLKPGEVATVEAEIAPVLDTLESLSGDFHVHSVPSPDSTVNLEHRIRTFLGEGVDVLVSTDHDRITDFRPWIGKLKAESMLGHITGVELTTFDYGHYNGFPMIPEPAARNEGALDWAGGTGPGLSPAQIFKWMKDLPGDQVIQVNHPDSGYLSMMQIDPLRGKSAADPAGFRLTAPPKGPDGDTGMWSQDFTAIEIMNGHGRGGFNACFRWWLAMVGRGFTPTATAVSDTHQHSRSLAGSPRTFVFYPPGKRATVTPLEENTFTVAVNQGRAIGTNGPYFTAAVINEKGERAGFGELVTSQAGEVTVEARIQTPEWMTVNLIEAYVNTPAADLGDMLKISSEPVKAAMAVPVELAPADLKEVSPGSPHRRYDKTVTFKVPVKGDSYVVLLVSSSGDKARDMFPVLPFKGVTPRAFSNPIYVDADGGGYDKPPLNPASIPPAKWVPGAPAARRATMDDVRQVLRMWEESHAH
ncbi:MAG: hypothetical protein GMKNLPBB_02787 [Myxococcota bacterium]|nr:hypothetical protein [Myxococcota bacterium]